MIRRIIGAVIWTLLATGPASGEWLELETGNHRIYFESEMAEYALAVSGAIRQMGPGVADNYEFAPHDRTSWVLHDRAEFFNGGAYTLLNHIELYSTTDDFDLRGYHPWVENVATHEFAHITTITPGQRFPRWLGGLVIGGIEEFGKSARGVSMAKGGLSLVVFSESMPRWFTEGIAQYEAERAGFDSFDTHRRMLQRTAWSEGKLLSFDQMRSTIGKDYVGGEMVYNQGYSWMHFLVDNWGYESLYNVIRTYGDSTMTSFNRAIEKTYGLPVTELDRRWRGHVERQAISDINRQPWIFEGEPFDNRGKYNMRPSVSPDGQWLAYVSSGSAERRNDTLVITPVTAPSEQTAIAATTADRAAWSLDSTFLVATTGRDHRRGIRQTYELIKVDPLSGEYEYLTERARMRWPAIDPTSGRLYAAQRSPGGWNLVAMTVTGATVTDITRQTDLPWGWQIRDLTFAPDGTLYATLMHGTRADLMRMDPDSPATVDILDWPDSEERRPAAATTGTVWFSSDRSGIFQAYVLDTTNGTIEMRTGAIGGVVDAAPVAATMAVATVYHHGKFQLNWLPLTAVTHARPISDVNWATVTLPTRAAGSASSAAFRPAKFRLARPLIYPEFEYLFGEPLGGVILSLADERLNHSLQLEGLFGESIDVNLDYSYSRYGYTGLAPVVGFSASRFLGDLEFALPGIGQTRSPFTWDSMSVSTAYRPGDAWTLGSSVGASRIRFEDKIGLLGVGRSYDRLNRIDADLAAIYSRGSTRLRTDIDPRGLTLYLAAAGARSTVALPQIDSTGNAVLDPATGLLELGEQSNAYFRGLGDLFWARGGDHMAAELGLRVGWISRDVDVFDEFFLGGNVFSFRRGEFRSFSNLPGYDDFAISGEKLVLARAATRAMLATNLGAWGPFLFDALLVEFALEAGNAWPDAARFGQLAKRWFQGELAATAPRPSNISTAAYDPDYTGFLYDAVVDLRLKADIFNGIPWNSYVRVAYGFQDDERFNVDQNRFVRRDAVPVRIYFGLGTGF